MIPPASPSPNLLSGDSAERRHDIENRARRSPATPPRKRIRAAWVLALLFPFAAAASFAADLKLGAQLIWGANDTPTNINQTLVGADLTATFRQHFKWTNYYEITNVTASIPLNQSRDVRMSDRCTLKVRNLGSSVVAVDCIGQGKAVSKGTNTLPCVYCGTNVNDTAWFIRLRSLDQK